MNITQETSPDVTEIRQTPDSVNAIELTHPKVVTQGRNWLRALVLGITLASPAVLPSSSAVAESRQDVAGALDPARADQPKTTAQKIDDAIKKGKEVITEKAQGATETVKSVAEKAKDTKGFFQDPVSWFKNIWHLWAERLKGGLADSGILIGSGLWTLLAVYYHRKWKTLWGSIAGALPAATILNLMVDSPWLWAAWLAPVPTLAIAEHKLWLPHAKKLIKRPPKGEQNLTEPTTTAQTPEKPIINCPACQKPQSSDCVFCRDCGKPIAKRTEVLNETDLMEMLSS